MISINAIKAGLESAIDLVPDKGESLRIVVLTQEEAEDAWKVNIGGAGHLLISSEDFFASQDKIWLHSRGTNEFSFSVTPPLPVAPKASLPLIETSADSMVAAFTADAVERKIDLKYGQIQSAGEVGQVRIGPVPSWRKNGVAKAPEEAEFSKAAKWNVTVPRGAMNDLSDLFLEVDYQGDIARLSEAGKLLTDDFYNGHPWTVGLGRFLRGEESNTFELSVIPRRKDAPVYFELSKPVRFSPNGQVDELDGLKLIPEYQLVISAR